MNKGKRSRATLEGEQQKSVQAIVFPSVADPFLEWISPSCLVYLMGEEAKHQAETKVEWSRVCDNLAKLPNHICPHQPLVWFLFDELKMMIEFDSTSSLKGGELMRNLSRVQLVPIHHFSSLLLGGATEKKLPSADEPKIISIVDVLYKLCGKNTPEELEISMKPADDPSKHPHLILCKNFSVLSSQHLGLLTSLFMFDILDVSFQIFPEQNFFEKKEEDSSKGSCRGRMTVMIQVRPSKQVMQHAWCSVGIIQTPLETFDALLQSPSKKLKTDHNNEV
jgi:hypothetical protein